MEIVKDLGANVAPYYGDGRTMISIARGASVVDKTAEKVTKQYFNPGYNRLAAKSKGAPRTDHRDRRLDSSNSP
jgi:hypothetical protein